MLQLVGKENLNHHSNGNDSKYTINHESLVRALEKLYPEVRYPCAKPPKGFNEFQDEAYRGDALRCNKTNRIDVKISHQRYLSEQRRALSALQSWKRK
jgi:hypothetical protein